MVSTTMHASREETLFVEARTKDIGYGPYVVLSILEEDKMGDGVTLFLSHEQLREIHEECGRLLMAEPEEGG